mmetsp:Transcript_43602/g.115126  ORF Transcript_43602/g.115126 Transcript_43602/m.115126 type:complete len:89 (-) Transcript_43602:97-363(-)
MSGSSLQEQLQDVLGDHDMAEYVSNMVAEEAEGLVETAAGSKAELEKVVCEFASEWLKFLSCFNASCPAAVYKSNSRMSLEIMIWQSM